MTNPENLEDSIIFNQTKSLKFKDNDLPPLDLNGVVGSDPSGLEAEFYLIDQTKDLKE